MSHGYQVQHENDLFVATVDEAMEQFAVCTAPGAFLANIFPIRESSDEALFMPSARRSFLFSSRAHPCMVSRSYLPEDGRRLAKNCRHHV